MPRERTTEIVCRRGRRPLAGSRGSGRPARPPPRSTRGRPMVPMPLTFHPLPLCLPNAMV